MTVTHTSGLAGDAACAASPECYICNDVGQDAIMLSNICACISSNVHEDCLQTWIRTSHCTSCSVCKKTYPAHILEPLYTRSRTAWVLIGVLFGAAGLGFAGFWYLFLSMLLPLKLILLLEHGMVGGMAGTACMCGIVSIGMLCGEMIPERRQDCGMQCCVIILILACMFSSVWVAQLNVFLILCKSLYNIEQAMADQHSRISQDFR